MINDLLEAHFEFPGVQKTCLLGAWLFRPDSTISFQDGLQNHPNKRTADHVDGKITSETFQQANFYFNLLLQIMLMVPLFGFQMKIPPFKRKKKFIKN